MSDAANGILGDSSGTDLPVMQPDETQLNEEKKMARYSKSSEFKRLEQHFKERIEFYQKYLPDGRPVASIPAKDLDGMWIAANAIIAELTSVLAGYELAAEAVDNANK